MSTKKKLKHIKGLLFIKYSKKHGDFITYINSERIGKLKPKKRNKLDDEICRVRNFIFGK